MNEEMKKENTVTKVCKCRHRSKSTTTTSLFFSNWCLSFMHPCQHMHALCSEQKRKKNMPRWCSSVLINIIAHIMGTRMNEWIVQSAFALSLSTSYTLSLAPSHFVGFTAIYMNLNEMAIKTTTQANDNFSSMNANAAQSHSRSALFQFRLRVYYFFCVQYSCCCTNALAACLYIYISVF